MSRRHALLDTPRRDDRGVVLVLFALVLVSMLAAAAFVIDLGMAKQERRKAQNAVDAAALGGVRDYEGTSATATVAKGTALRFLVANGYDVPVAATSSDSYACLTGGCTVDFTFANSPKNCLSVKVTGARVSTTFARAMGHEWIDVRAVANACNRASGTVPPSADDVPALFTKSTTCDAGKALDISGSNISVTGKLHSNGDVKVSGSDATFAGPLHANRDLDVSGAGNVFDAQVDYGRNKSVNSGNSFPSGSPAKVAPASPAPDFPVTFAISDYAPGGTRAAAAAAAGEYRSTTGLMDRSWLTSIGAITGNQLQPGLYYTSGAIDLDLAGVVVAGGRGVTFVSRQQATLKWATPGHVVTPYEPSGLLLFTDYMKGASLDHPDNCDSGALSLPDGTDFEWEGLVYAPRGQALVNGSNGTALSGSILALAMVVSGQHFSITADPALFPGVTVYEVHLDS